MCRRARGGARGGASHLGVQQVQADSAVHHVAVVGPVPVAAETKGPSEPGQNMNLCRSLRDSLRPDPPSGPEFCFPPHSFCAAEKVGQEGGASEEEGE